MSDFISLLANEFYVFALTALGMVLAYFGKRTNNDKKDK